MIRSYTERSVSPTPPPVSPLERQEAGGGLPIPDEAFRNAAARRKRRTDIMRPDSAHSSLPIYHDSLDWEDLYARFPVPDVFEKTVYRWSRDRIRHLQNERFMEVLQTGWSNEFYRRRWAAAGIGPGD